MTGHSSQAFLSSKTKIALVASLQLLCIPLIMYELLCAFSLVFADEPGDYLVIPLLALFFWLPYHICCLLCKKGYPSGLVIIPMLWLLVECVYLTLAITMLSFEPSFRFVAGEPLPNLQAEIRWAYYSIVSAVGIQALKVGLTSLKLYRLFRSWH